MTSQWNDYKLVNKYETTLSVLEVSTKSHEKREGSRDEGRKVSAGFKEEVRSELF